MNFKVGDVFTVPVDERRSGIGQIVGTWAKTNYYFAVFDQLVSERPAESEIQQALTSDLILLALSLDAKLYVGDWVVVGRAQVRNTIPFPAYKVQVNPPKEFVVEDYEGRRRRRASELEIVTLPYRAVIAPVRLENALRAMKGLGTWLDAYESMKPNYEIDGDRVFVSDDS